MSQPNVVDFYELEVLPILLLDPRSALPEFDFQPRRNGWEAGRGASQDVIDFFGARPDRIMLSKSKPGLIVVAGGHSCQLTAYVMRSMSPPRDEQFVKAVGMIADLVGVDKSPIDGTEMTEQERAQRRERMEAKRKEAEERRERLEEQHRIADQEAIKAALNYAAKAHDWTTKNGAKLAVDYFTRRGVHFRPGGFPPLPPHVLTIGDAGIKDRRDVSAVVFPMLDEDDNLTAVQRIFVDAKGRSTIVEVQPDKPTNKAVLGKPIGSRFSIGEQYVEQVCIITEGGETGMAVHVATGHRVECGMTAQGIETIKLRKVDIDRKRIRRIVVAGDLDTKGRGQEATAIAADRLRAMYKIPVVELLPTHAAFPELVSDEELPIKGKSVDFDDVHRECGAERLADFIDDSIARATVELQHSPVEEQDAGDEPPMDDGPNTGGFEPPREPDLIMPRDDLDAAHEYLMSRHLTDGLDCTKLMEMSGRIYRWSDGVYIELGDRKVLHVDIRRWGRPYRLRKLDGKNDDGSPKFAYPPARLSKNQIGAICDAAADEVSVLVQTDDFRTQFWMTPNIIRNGEQPHYDIDTPTWDRRIEDHVRADLPDPELLLSIEDGLLDLDAWVEHQDLTLLDHTPRFFTLSKIDIVLPLEEADHAMNNGGINALEKFARTLCPNFIKFLEATFHDDEDESAAPVTIRELMKVIGYYLIEDLSHHNGNITWFHGSPGTGKSTLMKVICALLGKRNVVSSNMYKISSQFHLASWIGKRLAVFADLDQGSRVDKTSNVEIFKMIATGDPMSVDRKHRDEIPNHVMKTRLLCSVNQMPHMPDPSNSLMRRSICFDFKNIPDEDTLDPMLEAKMTTPESLAGILLLAIAGLSHLKADGGFIQPEWSAEPLEQLAEQSSDYPDFIEQCIEITNEKTIDEGDYQGDFASAEDLYDAFCGYLTSVGTKHHPKRHRMLSELIPMLVASKPIGWKKVKQGRVQINGTASPKGYRGLKLTDAGESFARAHRGPGDQEQEEHAGFLPA